MTKPTGPGYCGKGNLAGPFPQVGEGETELQSRGRIRNRWGNLYGLYTFSGNPQETTFNVSLKKNLGLALRFLCHCKQVFSCALSGSLHCFSKGVFFFLFLEVNPLKQPGIFNSNNYRETSAGFFSLSTYQSSGRKDNIISTLFFPHVTSSFQSQGAMWACFSTRAASEAALTELKCQSSD